MKTAVSHRFTKRIIAWVMMFALVGGALLAFSSPAKAADDDELANYSFYKLSSSLAAFFSNAQSPDASEDNDLNGNVWAPVLEDAGSAGSMLGYVDKDITPSFEFLNSALSGSSSSIGYDSLTQSADGASEKFTDTPGMLDYAHFGATLNAMGLDSMSTGLSGRIVPVIAGGVMLLLYALSGAVDMMFYGIINTLSWLNPFRLFYHGVNAVNPTFAAGMTGDSGSPNLMGSLSGWIGEWYTVLNNLAWTVLVPLFIGVLLLGLVLAKNMNRGSAVKKLLIRLVFLGVGLPLVGSMYTGVLNTMGDASESGSAGSTQVVLSTYVDFETWAVDNRLYVPQGAIIEWDAGRSKPSANALANARNTALEINKSTNTRWSSIKSTLKVEEDQSWTDAALNDENGDNTGGVQGYTATMELLGRYVSGAKIDAASYENLVKGSLSTSKPYTNPGPEGQAQVNDWFIKFGDPKKSLPGITDKSVVSGNPVIKVAPNHGLDASPQGATSGTKTYSSPSALKGCYNKISTNEGEPRTCNMSTLSLYNYLNTSFGADSMTIYSSAKSTSGATREMHNSVTQVGTGTMSFLYWVNSAVLLASFIIIGFCYSLMMLFSNIKRGIQLMTAIPFATIGALPGIAKVIIYTVAMILEIILTLFLYRFVQQFLITIPQIVELPFSVVLNHNATNNSAVNLLAGGGMSMTMTTLSILAMIIFTVLALRVRSSVIKAVQEAVTKLVDKFMDTNVAPPGGGGMVPALAGGLASGAGMAAANKVMGGGAGGKKPGTSGTGPSAATAGGIPPAGGTDGGPEAGGPAGELTVGGGAGMEISGSEGDAGPDGSGSGPGGDGPGGTGGSGTGAGGMGGIQSDAASDQAVAKAVEAQGGLSEPGSRGSGDATDTMAGSASGSQAQHGEQDKSRGMAVAKGAEAAARGAAGDTAGAAAAGSAAAGHLRNSGSKGGQAKSGGKNGSSQSPSRSGASGGRPAKTLNTGQSRPGSGGAGKGRANTSGSAQQRTQKQQQRTQAQQRTQQQQQRTQQQQQRTQAQQQRTQAQPQRTQQQRQPTQAPRPRAQGTQRPAQAPGRRDPDADVNW